MRCISPHARYSIQVIAPLVKRGTDSTGTVVEFYDTQPVVCQFEHFAVEPHEAEAALESFTFKGLPEGVNPLTTLGVFDTELYQKAVGLNDEARELIEEKLRQKSDAQDGRYFIVVDAPRAPKPWPSYDDDPEEDILLIADRISFDREKILQYEKENQNRESLIVALSAEKEEEEAVEKTDDAPITVEV